MPFNFSRRRVFHPCYFTRYPTFAPPFYNTHTHSPIAPFFIHSHQVPTLQQTINLHSAPSPHPPLPFSDTHSCVSRVAPASPDIPPSHAQNGTHTYIHLSGPIPSIRTNPPLHFSPGVFLLNPNPHRALNFFGRLDFPRDIRIPPVIYRLFAALLL